MEHVFRSAAVRGRYCGPWTKTAASRKIPPVEAREETLMLPRELSHKGVWYRGLDSNQHRLSPTRT